MNKESENNPYTQISPHTCQPCFTEESSINNNKFCLVCGLLIIKTENGRDQSYRPSNFHFKNPFRFLSNSILEKMVARQGKNRYFNKKAFHLSFRPKLIEWLTGISVKLNFNRATTHLAISIVDVVLSLYEVKEKQIKLITFISLYMAAKMEDKDTSLPSLESVTELFDFEFDQEDFENCEKMIFKILNYNLNIQSPIKFTTFFVYRGVVFDSDLPKNMCESNVDSLMTGFNYFLEVYLDASVMCYDMYRFTSIAVAAAIIACARRASGLKACWNKRLDSLTLINWESIEECVILLEKFTVANFANELGNQIILTTPVKKQSILTDASTGDRIVMRDKTKNGEEQLSEFEFDSN